jgi:hypothetical protein
MSIVSIGYSPSQADAKDTASKIGYAKQILDFSGADLTPTPDDLAQLAFLGEFSLPESWSKRTEEYWNGKTYLLGVSKEAEANLTFVSRRKAVMQEYKEAMEGNTYLFLIELTEEPLNGKYQLMGFMGELVSPPEIGKSPRLPFGFQVGFATSDVSIDIKALQTAGDLANLAITLPTGATLDIAENQPFGIYEVTWP